MNEGIIISAVLASLAVLYLFLIAPRLRKVDMKDISVDYAHRGLHNNEIPENSLAAFRAAIEKGYGFELDLQLTSDGEVVVFHDYDLKRMCGADVKISALTLDELKEYKLLGTEERIPLFSEVLALNGGRVPMLVELKGENFSTDLCARAAELLDAYSGAYCVESFNPLYLRWFKKNRPNVARGQLYTNILAQGAKGGFFRNLLLSTMMTNAFSRPDFIAYDRRYQKGIWIFLTASLFGAKRFIWTVRDADEHLLYKQDGKYTIFEFFNP